jgi:glycerate kinase
VVESAAASGLVLAGGADGNDPLGASSRGTGELVVAALDAGARRIIVGVGGSAMTDGGSGAVAAIEEAGGLRGADVLVACDVQAVFVEAAARFGPQKGASPSEVGELTRRLEQLASSYLELYSVDVSVLPGAGAAGGLAGGLAAIGARLTPGFALVAGIVGLAERIEESELVVTAEGRLDASSWTGKVVGEVADCAARNRVPLVVVAGAVDPEAAREAHRQGIELVDLSARFGRERALADPAACIGEGLREVLAAGPPG